MDYQTRPNVVPWPPLLFAGAAAIALLLHWASPLHFPPAPLGTILNGLGALLIGVALVIDALAFLAFRRHRTTILPHKGADSLITTGIYGWSRNPIYLGNLLLVTGAGLFFGIWALIIAAPVALLATWKLAVQREEKHLAARFGGEWQAYTQKTGRWFGRR